KPRRSSNRGTLQIAALRDQALKCGAPTFFSSRMNTLLRSVVGARLLVRGTQEPHARDRGLRRALAALHVCPPRAVSPARFETSGLPAGRARSRCPLCRSIV